MVLYGLEGNEREKEGRRGGVNNSYVEGERG